MTIFILLPLVYYLATKGILSIPNSTLPDKKQFMNKFTPRGAHEERVTTFQGVDMSIVAWKDNKVVTLLSSYVDLAVINAWIIYKKKLIAKNVPQKDILNLGAFRNDLAFVLCNMGAAKESKRGRPSSSLLENEIQAKKKEVL
ncbi:unnamed protein product [Colias eurytheme]|nr:unnamed protein product [Colias eurytheme]